MIVVTSRFLARRGPQRLDRVHRRAVAFEADDLAVERRGGGADGDGEALPDSPAGELQPVMGRRTGGVDKSARAAGCALVGDDRAFGQEAPDNGAELHLVERTGRQAGLDRAGPRRRAGTDCFGQGA